MTEVTNEDMISIINKMLKQRNESVEMYQKAKRQDLVDKEKNEIEIIKEFLPQQLSSDEVKKVCSEAISSSGASKGRRRYAAAIFPLCLKTLTRNLLNPEIPIE